MAEQPSEETINKLLEELRSDAAYRRMAAIETIAEQRVGDKRIVNALKTMVTEDMSDAVKGYAQAALYALEHGHLPPDVPWSTASPPLQLSRNEKTRDFLIGFFAWWLVNSIVYGLLYGSFFGQYSGQYREIYLGLFCVLPFVFLSNIIVLIILAFRKKWVALGMLVALAINLTVSLILGLLTGAICFVPFFYQIN